MTHSFARAAADLSPVLSVRNLSVRYPETSRPAVKSVSFDIERGQTVLVAGSSGSGKSTLALALAGCIPESIEAEVTGDIHFRSDVCERGRIGYVFQDPETQFCMTQVDDEIAFGLENMKTARIDMQSKILRALRQVGLDVDLVAHHQDFSGGMKQKLAIASALALDAELFIFDEPTANLDPLATRQVYESIVHLREAGKTILVIEHKFEPLLPYVDNVIELPSVSPVVDIGAELDLVAQAQQPHADLIHSSPPDATKRVLELSEVHLSYGSKSVWRDVSFAAYQGDWIAILGPNGSGKSSLLEVMAGLTSPSHGQVKLFEQSIDKIPPRERYRKLGYGFQNPEYQFLFERTCDEVAGHFVGDTIPADVMQTLREYGLQECAEHSPYQLSQGQKRRLAVAVMLRENHDIYLFDEPTYGQDSQSEQWILGKLNRLVASGKTVVTVTHDVMMAREYATRALVLADGELLYDGLVDALFTRERVLEKAHLLDDVRPVMQHEASCETQATTQNNECAAVSLDSGKEMRLPVERRSPMGRVHPGLKLFTLLFISTLTMFVNDFSHLAWMWGMVVFLSFGFAWCRPQKMVKRLSVLLVFYVAYIWTFAANATVPPGSAQVQWLWFHISMYGFWQGVLVALRTFATVIYAYVFLATTDITSFLVSLSQSFKIPPKLPYAMLAGTSFIPQIERDVRTLRQAKAVRGRRGRLLLRPATYALPLLSQAVRHSERMAIAMEARGFRAQAANAYHGRTYYRSTPIRIFDVAFASSALIVAVVLFAR